MKELRLNMIIKALALPVLAVSVLISCSIDPSEEIMPMYSARRSLDANYQVMGSVSDQDGDPICGIMVIADYTTGVVYQADTLYTDKEGRFSKFITIPRVAKFYMSFTDIDGVANGGRYQPVSDYFIPVCTEKSSGHFGGSYIVNADVSLSE